MKTHLSHSENGWCLMHQGSPLCDYKPHLTPTGIVGKGTRHITKSGKSLPKWYNLPPSADRWKIRSATFQGIADAMAAQWSSEQSLF